MTDFLLTTDHLKLLRRANISWNGCEYGSPGIDPKRPFGNSSVNLDIAEILGWEEPSKDVGDGYFETDYESPAYPAFEKRCRAIHSELETALQIVVRFAGLLEVKPGLYRQAKEYQSWEKIGE